MKNLTTGHLVTVPSLVQSMSAARLYAGVSHKEEIKKSGKLAINGEGGAHNGVAVWIAAELAMEETVGLILRVWIAVGRKEKVMKCFGDGRKWKD